MPTADIALFSRLIFLQFPRSTFTQEEKKNYMRLMEMRSGGLTHLTISLLKYRKRFEERFTGTLKEVRKQVSVALQGKQCEDRIVNNWCVPLAELCVLQDAVSTLAYDDLFKIVIKGILNRMQSVKRMASWAVFGMWCSISRVRGSSMIRAILSFATSPNSKRTW